MAPAAPAPLPLPPAMLSDHGELSDGTRYAPQNIPPLLVYALQATAVVLAETPDRPGSHGPGGFGRRCDEMFRPGLKWSYKSVRTSRSARSYPPERVCERFTSARLEHQPFYGNMIDHDIFEGFHALCKSPEKGWA